MAYALLSILSRQTTSMHFSAAGALADAAICGDPMRKGADERCYIKPPSTVPLAGMNSREGEGMGMHELKIRLTAAAHGLARGQAAHVHLQCVHGV